ncbi:MAG: sigma-70 family RNA polymerase sigma factor [Verrucomicrobiales bacterium]|nr:sigma-70 family RNA polymerase sigma factor [Verrucomicrobiales bacterium]
MPESTPHRSPQDGMGRDFRTTHWSIVALAGQQDSEAASHALESLCRGYWYPIFAYLRHRGHDPYQAEDLTQAFFTRLLEKNYLASADRERGRFRTFLLAALNHFLANEWNRSQAQKRGGGCQFISLEYAREQDEHSLQLGHDLTPERVFERRWAETVLAKVLDRLQSEFDGATIKRFQVLKPFLTEDKGSQSYAEAAAHLQLTEAAVKSAIHRLRLRWRELMREEIAHTLHSTSPQEVDNEIRHLISALD